MAETKEAFHATDTDQGRAVEDRVEGQPTRRREIVSGRLLLAGVVVSELACLAVFVALVL
jgi:hypothetical protein